MNIKGHVGIDIKFKDVPDECKVRTYLYSQVAILYYDKDKCTVFDECNNVRQVFAVHLDANNEELQKCQELFMKYVESIKKDNPIGVSKDVVGVWRSFISSRNCECDLPIHTFSETLEDELDEAWEPTHEYDNE